MHDMDHVANIAYEHRAKEVMADMDLVLQEHFEQIWLAGVNSVEARGLNKLRTYRTFKQDFVTEQYVFRPMPRSHRSALARFRCGVAPIRIETGRYERLPLEERLCPVCDENSVESEFHVIMQCQLYTDIRQELFYHTEAISNVFRDMSPEEQFRSLMSENCTIKYAANACHQILKRRRCYTHNEHF